MAFPLSNLMPLAVLKNRGINVFCHKSLIRVRCCGLLLVKSTPTLQLVKELCITTDPLLSEIVKFIDQVIARLEPTFEGL